jgi:hypothetical protein
MINGEANRRVNRRIIEFRKREFISLSELKDMVLTWNKPYRLYTTKLSGANRYYSEAFTVPGPSGRALYDYAAKGYMVVFDNAKNEFRTIVWNRVEKVTDLDEDKTYYVR